MTRNFFPGYQPPEDPELRRMRRLATKHGLRLEKRRGRMWRSTGAGTFVSLPPYRLWVHESVRRSFTTASGVQSRGTFDRWRMVAEGDLSVIREYLEKRA